MAKKRPPKKEEEAALPKFGGFNALAAGLGDLKAKLDEDAKRAAAQKPAAPKAPAPAPPRVHAPQKPPPPKPSDGDDEHAFHRMMSGVTPLEGRSQRVGVGGGQRVVATERLAPAELKERAKKEAADVLEHLHSLVDDVVRFEVTDDGKHVEGRRNDVPPTLVRQLRRGLLPIDGRLDLHGLDARGAEEKLGEFLRTMRARRERCVLVIHGKGERSPGGGVLRGEISAWLSQGRAREHVAAFVTANADDGGEGALYVALRQ